MKTAAETSKVDLNNTEVAFRGKSNKEMQFMYYIFRLMAMPKMTGFFSKLGLLAIKLHLPITWLIKPTIFKQFCGGETMEECDKVRKALHANNVRAILDYSVEGKGDEQSFNRVKDELLRLILHAKENSEDPTTCVKITGLGSHQILEKVSEGKELSQADRLEYAKVVERIEAISKSAFKHGVKLYIDAEESWIQPAIDTLAESLMTRYNKERAIVFTTIQLYRHDRLAYLEQLIAKAKSRGYVLGVKLVRGAYLEKETARAISKRYENPMQPTKKHTDDDYNKALAVCIEHIDTVEICAGTHNSHSCLLLTEYMHQKGLAANDQRIYFSQLYGMSDNLSFNLSNANFNVSKYLPYGPVKDTLPYLIRRAQENTAVAGQMGGEISLIMQEITRRKSQK